MFRKKECYQYDRGQRSYKKDSKAPGFMENKGRYTTQSQSATPNILIDSSDSQAPPCEEYLYNAPLYEKKPECPARRSGDE